MHQNIDRTPATLDQHQYAWDDYKERLRRAIAELATMHTNATTPAERDRLDRKSQALADVANRWITIDLNFDPPTTADQYVDLWGAFAQRTFNDWVPARLAGDAGDVDSAAYATGLGLASDLQRGYGYGIDTPPYIVNWFELNPPN